MAAINSDPRAELVEAVLHVQALVARRAEAEHVYQAVVDGALRLLGAEIGSLRFVDLEDAAWMVAVASTGCGRVAERWRQRSPITEGASGRVISTGALVAIEGGDAGPARSRLAPADTHAVIAVPVRERERVIGSLLVATADRSRRWTPRDRELLVAYGDHVSVALAVARASHAMHQAFTDSLTGLGNRALLLDRLDHELVRADRGGQTPTVLFLDLDRFKLVNDSLGHLVGDQLLISVAERLRHATRGHDVCARLGGDEFAVLLAGTAEAERVAERIIRAFKRPFEVAGHVVFVSVSIGIASGREEAETVLRNADVAMYRAKRAGGARYQRFEPSMHAALVSRLDLDTELRRAVERGEFELHYQPLFDLESGRIAALESLVRWRHPVRGLVPPIEFVPVAEENGLIAELGRWVLAEACRQFAVWWRQTPLAISVNVSMRELQLPGYAAAVEQAIGSFPSSALILEVTESVRMEDAPNVLASLREIRELGVRVALDDFGTGYSSLLTLAHLPIDLLKIPRPFLPPAGGEDPSAAGLLAGIVGIGQHLGLATVAEGIELPEQHALLSELGCDLGQGYLLGRPADAARTTELLRAQV
jgi:diguanylate cyclase (GGDEF)-like protein